MSSSEIQCPNCFHPAVPAPPLARPVANLSTHHFSYRDGLSQTSLVVADHGAVPVIHGDPKWLPEKVRAWVCEKVLLMRPSEIYICCGSVFEAQLMTDMLLKKGVLEKCHSLDNVYVARTDPQDTVRMEKNTYIVTSRKDEVEANRRSDSPCELARWMSRAHAADELEARFPGCMRGRTMYVVPFSMGPIAGQFSKNAVHITDSPYVVLNMRVVSRVSSSIWDAIGSGTFVRCVHSVGTPRPVTRKIVKGWPCNPDRALILHYLPENEVWSFGSGFGGNSLLGKKCLALRIGSYLGWKEGWLAEHAAIICITDPAGKETFVLASFPSGAGKTALATMVPALPGWKVQVLGDDIAWIRFTDDGQMMAMAPENGMFGIASDVRPDSGANIVQMLKKDALLVNCGTTSKGRPMWQGMEGTLEEGETVKDWKGADWKRGDTSLPAHPNSRFTVFTSAAPNVHPKWDDPKGVPISAIIYGSRRPDEMPLVMESRDWATGVLLAAGLRTLVGNTSDKKSSGLVHDPMSMRPFMSYNFSKYVQHWLNMDTNGKKVPKMFHVNWYQPGADGKPIWPGYGQNIRVLEWILRRVHSPATAPVTETPIGLLPMGLNTEGLTVDVVQLLQVRKPFWLKELEAVKKYFDAEMGETKPAALITALNALITNVQAMAD